MRIIQSTLFVIVLLLFGTGITSFKSDAQENDIFNISINPEANEAFLLAVYTLYIPPNVKELKGIIVHQHGCGRNGLSIVYDFHWRALAIKNNYALMGTHYLVSNSCENWSDPKAGSGRAFLSALDEFAVSSGHPELSDVPWALWGHSGGARWSCRMLEEYPERIVGVYARSLALPYSDDALKVPVIISMGRGEQNHPVFNAVWEQCNAAFSKIRKENGLAALVVDPITAHDCGKSRFLAIPFLDAYRRASGSMFPLYTGYSDPKK